VTAAAFITGTDTSGSPGPPFAGTNGGKAPFESTASRCTVSPDDDETITAVPATIIRSVTTSSDGASRRRRRSVAGASGPSAG
jgi:hypothetical protein